MHVVQYSMFVDISIIAWRFKKIMALIIYKAASILT